MDKTAHLATEQEMDGSKGLTEARTLNPKDAGYQNPGATKNLRGVEANTARSKGMPMGAPEGVTILNYAHGAVPPVDPFRTHEGM